MKQLFLISAAILVMTGIRAQDKPAYRIFSSNGKSVKYGKMLQDLESADVLLFGEQHNNAISHWLELEVSMDLLTVRPLILGAEMIEADNQDELDKYLSGEIDSKGLDSMARLWPNYKTDYKPLVDFAKDKKLRFIACNVPRRYASMVYKRDFEALDTLSDEEKSWMAPLPIDFDPNIKTYQEILEMMGDHGNPKLVKAQAIKDATMAYFILKNRNDKSLFIHYNGAYHSDQYEGILWHMKRKAPDLNYKTISTVSQENIDKLDEENLGRADYIICVDSDMTTTY